MAVEPSPLKTSPPPPDTLPDLDRDLGSPSKSYWWVWLLIFALIGYGCYALYKFETAKKAAMNSMRGNLGKQHAVPVVAEAAHMGNMPVYLEGLGTVTAFNTVTVKPRIDGQLISVNFKEGQFVKQGDVLAEIDPRPYQVALAQAEGSLAQAKGTLAKDQAALKDAQVNAVRDQELFKESIIAKQQLDTQVATVGQAQGQIEADKASIEAAQAAIDTAKLNLTYTKITAPLSGRIGLRQVDSGNMVHSADTNGIAVITQLQPISVLFSIPEDQLPQVLEKLRAGAKMPVTAYDRAGRTKLAEGTLLTVDNQIDQTTGTSRLKAVFPNNDMALFPNQFVNVRLALDVRKNVLIVPADAIQRGPTGTFVYVVRSDNTVAVRSVKVGLTEGDSVSIDDGLQAGDRVVTDGAEKLNEGMKVSLRPATPGGTHHRSDAAAVSAQ
ncbi:MAG TPA: MdtA/MuxA family multidrug efflux RND transporter periplasmic adaptor subunit [Bryobacteraceae bacterium]|nr:MdtA/MuxA family multidrug efflux RND transporter periplasmic adaptor subunit [Bryobacteraceae bacterium]